MYDLFTQRKLCMPYREYTAEDEVYQKVYKDSPTQQLTKMQMNSVK